MAAGITALFGAAGGGFTAGSVISGTAALASVGTGVASALEAREAAEQQKKANRVRKSIAELRNRRSRLRQISQARQLEARAVATGESRGAGTGSTVQGQVSGIRTDLGSNLGFLQAQTQAEESIFKREQRAVDASTRSSLFSSASKITGETLGGQAKISSIFEDIIT